jgi:TetR/AcrR family transcriptional regulator, transcriptional repressor for nem operon
MTTAEKPARLTRKGAATRARIVEAAARLMFERGVAGTSTEDVRTASGVSNSQLYHYFADKNALVQAVIAHQTEEIPAGQQPLLSSLDSMPALEAWRDLLVDMQRERQCAGGCPLGSLSTELADCNETARVALADGFARWESPIRDGLRRMQARHELPPDADVESLALGILAALQGGLLLTQAMRDVAPLQAGLNLALDHVGMLRATVAG